MIYEFVCAHIVPGCTVTERAEDFDAVKEKALRHLEEHHGLRYLDEDAVAEVGRLAIAMRGG